MSKKCQHCGANLADDAVFCANCGAKQNIGTPPQQDIAQPPKDVCKHCGAVIIPGSAFCPNCGAQVEGTNNVQMAGGIYQPDNGGVQIEAADNEQKGTIWNTIRSAWKIISGIFAVILIVIYLFTGQKPGQFLANTFAGTPKVTVKAQTLMNDYMRNPRNADKKYKDKVIRVTGQVIDKGQFDNTNNYYLQIAADFDRGKTYDVTVDIDSKKAKEANKVREMDFVDVTGTCVGIVKQRDPDSVSIQIKADKVNE